MKRLLKEPLLHFLLAGALLFALYTLVGRDDTPEVDQSKQIVVSTARIKTLSQNFAKVWQRPPTSEELDGLIQNYIRQEIMYREALAMGLDKDDTIVRRRMQQKMEFIFEDLASGSPPTDEELSKYLQSHPEAFETQTRFTFKHVYLNQDKRGNSIQDDVEQLLATLKEQGADADITKLGDSLLLGQQFEDIASGELQNRFGKVFATAMAKAPVKVWHGPVQSGYGLHLVFISTRSEGALPKLAQVRDAVEREWSAANRRKANKAFYEKLRNYYSVEIKKEEAQPTATSSKDPKQKVPENVGAGK